MTNDTITAAATFPLRGAISVVRISGPQTFPILSRIFEFSGRSKNFDAVAGHTVSLGLIKESGKTIDEAMVSVFKKPRSYTGEDMAELSCHGSPFIVNKILRLLIESGCRVAEPGEFTKRAFLNGKLDLSQAEAVSDIVSARNDAALSIALSQLLGREKEVITSLRAEILSALSEIEAGIDFSHENIGEMGLEKIRKLLAPITERVEKLMQSADEGIKLKEGIKITIAGKPNSGKSSLMNALAGKNRSIVTHIPGTTRDIIEDSITLEGLPFRIIDTAGIRPSRNKVEKEGIKRAKAAVREADAVIFLLDGSKPLSTGDSHVFRSIKGKKFIPAVNKSDLRQKLDIEKAARLFSFGPQEAVPVSAKKKTGLKGLTKAMKNIIIPGEGAFRLDSILISSTRHRAALFAAKSSLRKAQKELKYGGRAETAAVDIKQAASRLSAIIGEVSSEDVLSEIFKNFCIGK